jgi:hypothetical protein
MAEIVLGSGRLPRFEVLNAFINLFALRQVVKNVQSEATLLLA